MCSVLSRRRDERTAQFPNQFFILFFFFHLFLLVSVIFYFFAIIVAIFLRSLYILYKLQSTAIASSAVPVVVVLFYHLQFAKCSCCLLRFLNDYWLKFIIVVVSFVSFITGNEFLNDVLFYSLWNNLNFLLSDVYVVCMSFYRTVFIYDLLLPVVLLYRGWERDSNFIRPQEKSKLSNAQLWLDRTHEIWWLIDSRTPLYSSKKRGKWIRWLMLHYMQLQLKSINQSSDLKPPLCTYVHRKNPFRR